MAGTRILATLSGAFALLASLVYTLTITRRLSTYDLATLTIFNSAFAVATAVLGYVTTWYPRILAKEPQRFPQLATVGLLTALVATASLGVYLALFGRLDPILLALGAAALVAYSWPASAFLSLYRQKQSVVSNFASQAIKLVSAYFIKQSPSAYLAIATTTIMAIPPVLCKVTKPVIKEALHTIKIIVKGTPFQTLYLLAVAISNLTTFALLMAGGDKLLSYLYILFQVGKSVYPALTISTLMYGSLLVENDKLKRALIDGAIYLYLFLLVATIMAKTPEWYLAVLRPTELYNSELIMAIRLAAFSLIFYGIYTHIDTTLRGVEEKTIFSLRDKPAKALIFDIIISPLNITLMYVLAKIYGISGVVITQAIIYTFATSYRLKLLGTHSLELLIKLYIPTITALVVISISPIPLVPYNKGNIIEVLITYIPNIVILSIISALLMISISPPSRQVATFLIRKYLSFNS
jgi:hypothetical protein